MTWLGWVGIVLLVLAIFETASELFKYWCDSRYGKKHRGGEGEG